MYINKYMYLNLYLCMTEKHIYDICFFKWVVRQAMEGLGAGRGVSDKGLAVLLTNRALCFQKLEVWDKARPTHLFGE